MSQTYRVTTDQGVYNVTVDDPPAAPVDRGGLAHPATSVVAPELEAARGALNTATATPHGQPIMARSRTGTLYPSEAGTGAVNAVKAAARGAGGAVLDQVEGVTSPVGLATMGAAKGVAMLAESPALRRIAGRGLQMISDFDFRKPFKSTIGSAADALTASAENAAPAGVDRYMANSGGMPTRATSGPPSARIPYAPPTENAAPAGVESIRTPAPMSDLELARQEVAAGRLPQSALGAIERAQTGPAKTPPGMIREPLKPTAAPAESPLQQPRVDIGAEKVGRQQGLSKEAVRQQTAPILGEQPGEASPIFPEKVTKRIIDDLRALPRGGPERDAYVARATSGKAQWQVENFRRALEHLGLIVPIAAGAGMARSALVDGVKQ